MPKLNLQQRINGNWVIAHLIHNEFTSLRQDFYIAQQFEQPRGFMVYTDSEIGKRLVGVCNTEDSAYLLVRSLFKG